jgi:hypothetical protein
MNSTSFFYAHSDQWRYETLGVDEILSPTAPEGDWSGSMIDYNVRAERMGWLPSAPQLKVNPLGIAAKAAKAGMDAEGLCGQGAERRRAGTVLPRSRKRSAELAAQPVYLAFQPAGLLRQGPRIFPEAPPGHASMACRARIWARKARQAGGGRLA